MQLLCLRLRKMQAIVRLYEAGGKNAIKKRCYGRVELAFFGMEAITQYTFFFAR